MALTTGMLERFKSMVSETDNQLLKINLTNFATVRGYLREVGSDFFVLDEVRSVATDRNAFDRYANTPDYEYSIKKLGRTTIPLGQIVNWSEISEDILHSS